MSTRSSARNLFPPLDNPELTIRRRSRVDPTLLNDFEMDTEGNGDLPVPDLQTMEELCQPSLNGRGGPITPISFQETNFGLKNDKIQQVQNSCQFHGLPGDDANKHLDKFLHVTQSIKVNGVTDDALRLYLFPHYLTHHATTCFDRLPRNSINTFEQMAKMFLKKYFPPSMVTKLKNKITNFRQRPDESLFEAWEHYKLSIDRCLNHNMLPVTQIDTFYNGLTLRHRDTINAAAGGTFMKKATYMLREPIKVVILINLQLKSMFGQFMKMNTASSSGSGTLPGNTVTNPKEDLKGITTRSGNAYQGRTIVTTFSSLPPVVERETEVTMDTVHPTNNESTKDVHPLIVQTKSPIMNSEPVVAPIIEPIAAPVSALKPSQRPLIPYPSILHDQKLRDKANDQREKFFQIFKDLNFNISFADALILMPKFGPTIKTLLTNKDKLSELARTPLNEHCSVVLLKKLPKKLGDPDKFLIPCDFLGMAECLALADLGASINLMPLSVWNKLSLPDLSPTCMTLKLADRSISRSVRVAEDVFVKVGTFYFPSDFVVVDFDANPRVPLILERSFLNKERALIDVFEANYNDMTANRIDVIDMACEEYSQEVLGFSNVIASGNPTPYYDLIVSTTSLTLTPFGNNDFLLEEVDAFLALDDDPTSLEVDHEILTIILLEAFLNDDPSLPLPNQGNYLPQVRRELKICEAKTDKSSIDEPPEVELKDLPPHLEYTFLEGDDKLPVIIAKDLSVEEKTTLITILKFHKKVNPKIHDVIKNEVLKLLDAGLIYTISDSPWVSLVHCVPKKGGFTVVENEENELISTRLVLGWRICIDYRKLNEATHKDYFPLPFMDQMLERLARNEYYYFLDGFSGYFQIPIDPKDQEKTTFTCPYETFAYRRMDFGLCNAPGTFQREESLEVDKAKVDVIAKLPHPTTIKGIRSFLGHAGFYRRLIKDFSKIARPMTRLLEKDTPFLFSKECVEAFQTLKIKFTEAPILSAPDWDLPFELMCDASDFAIERVKYFGPIHYASKTMTEAELSYTTMEKEILAVVYAFEKFRSYLIMNKIIVYTDHSTLKYLFAKKDSKARLLRWVLLLQEFTFKVIDTKGDENLAADHLSRLKNPHQNVLDPKEINESFPLETLNMVSFHAGSESRPPMLNKENYVPWSSCLLRYAKSRPNGKLIHNSILNGPYVRKIIPEPGDANHEINVTETFHLQTNDELSGKELKPIEADDQAIQTILLGLPEDICAAADSCETAQEIWLRVQQMMKGSDIRIQEKKAKLFNELERFTSNEGESIEPYYHRFLKLMNDLKRNKYFPEKIASNLNFLNNLQPEWSRHVTIIHQTKDLHTADYTQLYDFLKYNKKEADELKAKRLAKTQDPLVLMANSNNPYAILAPHQGQSSFNQNYLQQPMTNPEGITDPTTAMNMALV
nr:DNA-directed DNA polymerase [Tanacetum cinerariifolium]